MAKIMLVEDDNNLREIYEARLAAEGYEIVSAQDGEEALALAVKERPDLIIADIMMPKVSGFDMLDILRGTPETKNAKIIMMTALSQAEDKSRAEKLGADRYLVKSQVTLEDVVKVATEILNEAGTTSAPASAPTPAAPAPEPNIPLPTPVADDTSAPATPTPEPSAPATPLVQEDVPVTPPPAQPGDDSTTVSSAPANLGTTTTEEEAEVSKQIESFIAGNPTLTTSTDTPAAPAAAPESTPAPAAPKEESTPSVTSPEFTEEVIGTTPPPAADPVIPKATSIPVTQADEEPAPPAPQEANTGSDADQTLATAVDSLVNSSPSAAETPKEESTPSAEVSDGPEPAKKRGGERVIEPLPSTGESKPMGEELVALASSEPGVGTQPPGAQTAVSSGNTMEPTPQETSGLQPGQVIQAGNNQPPAGPASSDPGSVAL